MIEFVVYTTIPFYVAKSGATLLNLSDTTTIIWSMLFDYLLYAQPFRWLPLIAFVIEVIGIVIFNFILILIAIFVINPVIIDFFTDFLENNFPDTPSPPPTPITPSIKTAVES